MSQLQPLSSDVVAAAYLGEGKVRTERPKSSAIWLPATALETRRVTHTGNPYRSE